MNFRSLPTQKSNFQWAIIFNPKIKILDQKTSFGHFENFSKIWSLSNLRTFIKIFRIFTKFSSIKIHFLAKNNKYPNLKLNLKPKWRHLLLSHFHISPAGYHLPISFSTKTPNFRKKVHFYFHFHLFFDDIRAEIGVVYYHQVLYYNFFPKIETSGHMTSWKLLSHLVVLVELMLVSKIMIEEREIQNEALKEAWKGFQIDDQFHFRRLKL